MKLKVGRVRLGEPAERCAALFGAAGRFALPFFSLILILHNPGSSQCGDAKNLRRSSKSSVAFQSQLDTFLSQPRFSTAAWGAKVVSLQTGKTVFEHNAGKLLKPASNAKLFTAALALDRLGPDFRIRTSLYAVARPDAAGALKSDLIVYGRGDPSFAARFNSGDYSKSLEPLVNALTVAGVKRIEGDLVGDETHFRGPPQGSGWTWDDLQYYYGAEVSALTVEDNVLDLVFKPGKSVGDPCEIAIKPETSFVTFINRAKTVAKSGRRNIELYRPVGENVVYLTGQVPLEDSPQTDAVAVHNAPLFFVTLLKEALARQGIGVSGNVRAVRWTDPVDQRIDRSALIELATVESRPLREIVSKTLKPSQNLYAQLLLLQVGASSSKPEHRRADPSAVTAASQLLKSFNAEVRKDLIPQTSEELGIVELKKFLTEAGIPEQEVLLEEGSGLSRSCLVTPNATVRLLRFMARHRCAEIFREALPIAGVDGTLRNRMKETKAARRVQAKTGHIRYVDTLSGYLNTPGAEPLAFSIMLNNYSNPARSGRDEVDALAVMLAEFAESIRGPNR